MMRISELARKGGVGVETVRFYQRKGLLPVPRGDAPGGRHYGEGDVKRLRYIRQAQVAGFTLAEIAELIDLDRTDDRPRAREMARERIAALDGQIATLQAARESLARLARDCAKGGDGPCPILDAFDPDVISGSSASVPRG
jgi:MerR family mercuric resistance operon transcriptional regulator